jgi:hypothetical protein
MKTLKEKFGQFEMTKEQMKMVKGGICGCFHYQGNNVTQCRSTQGAYERAVELNNSNGGTVTSGAC